jgi:hypothetical protein
MLANFLGVLPIFTPPLCALASFIILRVFFASFQTHPLLPERVGLELPPQMWRPNAFVRGKDHVF